MATATVEDKALDALTIEDKKRQYAAAKNYLEDLSSLLSDLGLNIREEHVFSTTDGNSLDVLWWMDGWSIEGEKRITDLKSALKVKIRKRFFLHKVEKDLAAVTD
ncbi:serine/threonine-protein kinase STY17 isoform X2 [Pyrus x bretschneideri]|uniref:serine/threonine-protein kinase STY17 isoform X2 n=1 Tax=Pyrus x bretschneideri TaxID=225117 RepID=UPI00202FDCA2|nr:serine/threonine-protein kinase STY17 isoform X2 [Pyrus x bretschneideri]XP_048420090.1 serine/threonine-protein kinase STY17 isoform X2 [Pyrus x bretschneideri]